MIACVSPSLIVSVTPLRISLGPSSLSTWTWRSLISTVLISSCLSLLRSQVVGRSSVRLEDVLRELGLDGREQLLLDGRDADLADQVVEEAVHDESLGLLLRDAV